MYFASEPARYAQQRQNRIMMRQIKRLPSEFEAIAILVEKIKYPQLSLEELAERNIQISPRGASSLGSKFIVYLAIAHDRCSDDITEVMRLRGEYTCHLDATCEGRDPILMSSLDSISQIKSFWAISNYADSTKTISPISK